MYYLKMKLILVKQTRLLIILIGLNFMPLVYFSCCIEDNRSLPELLLQEKNLTIFKCKILSSYTDSNSNYLSSALLIEVYFGTVKNKYITLNTGSRFASTGGGALPVGIEMMVYSGGSGTYFHCGGICDSRTHPIENNIANESEAETLKLFSAIYRKNKSGSYKFYTADNKVLSEGHFRNGVPVGIWKHYNYNGKIKQQIDLDTKDAIYYNQSGEITQEDNNYKDSLVTINYVDKQKGILMYRNVRFPNDSGFVNVFYVYFSNGNLKSIEGVCYVKHSSNSISGKGKKGKCHEYFESGGIKLKGLYEKDRRVGMWFWYEANGAETARFDYRDGSANQ